MIYLCASKKYKMTLIKSISGIRGTIGGKTADNLTPLDVVKFASAYGVFIKNRNDKKKKIKVVIGRDARISGKMISSLVANTLVGLGIDVVDCKMNSIIRKHFPKIFRNSLD